MSKKELKLIFVIILVFFTLITIASAVTLFSDTFEDGSISDWTTTGGAGNWHTNTTGGPIDPPIDSWHIISTSGNSNPVYAERSISTSSYQSIVFSFYYKPDTNDLDCADGDFLRGEWYDGSVWNTILDICGNVPTTYTFSTTNLNSAANNNPNFKIRFGCRGGAGTEGCAIDNVTVTGSLITDTTPPTITLNSPLANQFINTNSVTFNITLNENGSAWYTLNNGINNITMSTTNNQNFNHTNTSISDSQYNVQFYANDTTGNINNTVNVTFTIDSTKPLISIITPQNTSYNTLQTQLNYSVSDTNLQSCWYSLNNGQTNTSLSCGQNVSSLSSNQGSNTWTVYSNDSSGNANSSSITFFIDSITPLISYGINTPQNNSILSQNSIFINVSVTETNEANITFSLYNSSSLINQTTFTTPQRTINFTSLQDGIYFYNVTIKDTLNNQNATETRTITLDTISPTITITSPQNTSYITSSLQINFTVSDTNLQFCWYTNNSGTTNITLANCNNISYTASQGSTTITIYSNDSVNNRNSTSVTFFVDSITPSLSIAIPQEGATFGINTSLALNFTASDTNLQSCWYHIDAGNNISIPNCINTTFNTSAGSHTLYLYANDTLNNKGSGSVNFTISLGAPTITQNSPINIYLNSAQIQFNYTATDVDLDSCELWGNFTGTYSKNQTNSTLISGQQSLFSLTLNDGTYIWAISCNDTLGNSAITGNKTFFVDTQYPTISLTEPTGTKTSRNNIPLTFSASDLNLQSCQYNVFRGLTIEITNTTIDCNSTTTFNVTVDADFTLNFYVNDSAGNINSSSTSFTVDTSSPSPPSGGGGSSGGGSSSGGGAIIPTLSANKTRIINLEFTELEALTIKRGTAASLNLEVTNKERVFLNNCKLEILGPLYNWLSNEQTNGLSAGEKFTFTLNLTILNNAQTGEYRSDIKVQCDEGHAFTPIKISIFRNSFEAQIIGHKKEANKLRVNYTIEEFADETHQITLNYELINFEKIPITKGQEQITLAPKEKQDNVLEFELPKDSFGEFDLKFIFTDEKSIYELTEKVLLPSPGLLGLAISDNNRQTLSIVGIILTVAVITFFISQFIYKKIKKRKTIKELQKKYGKGTIKIDVKHEH